MFDDPIERWFKECERDPDKLIRFYTARDIQYLAECLLGRLLDEEEFEDAVHRIEHLEITDLVEYCIREAVETAKRREET